jgi:GTP pyrophosphokinase
VNHNLVSIGHKLKSGDQVEILTSKQQHVERSWLNLATTAKATTKIQALLRREEREARQKGEEMLDEFLQKNEMVRDTAIIDKLCDFHHKEKAENLFLAIGQKRIKLGDEDVNFLLGKSDGSASGWKLFFFGRRKSDTGKKKDKLVIDQNFDRKKVLELTEDSIQSKYTLKECCKPIPGDPVMGYIDDQNHIVIHKLQCSVAARLKANHGNRVLAAEWNMNREMLFPVEIKIQGLDKLGLLNQMTQIISQQLNVNMHKLIVECNDGIVDCFISLFVYDTSQVDALISGLKQIQGINSVVRV